MKDSSLSLRTCENNYGHGLTRINTDKQRRDLSDLSVSIRGPIRFVHAF